MRNITLTRPDDWHIHLRDGDYLKDTVADVARYFGRAIVMPNIVPAVDTVAAAEAYRDRIIQQIPAGAVFQPLMTLYITPETNPETVKLAKESGIISAFKFYPAGATTNSESGVSEIESMYPVFEAMQDHEIPLCLHGEVTHPETDIFDREAIFIDSSLQPLVEKFASLKIILEHITTKEAVEFVLGSSANVAATITAHHLMYNRNDMLAGGIKPIQYCLPILKRNTHQNALLEAATCGSEKFFLGTDSAPHPRSRKENMCGCAAGCYTAHAALELYAEVFDSIGKLDRLEAFSSFYGPDFYGLPRNQDKITLTESPWQVPEYLKFGDDMLGPIKKGDVINWRVV